MGDSPTEMAEADGLMSDLRARGILWSMAFYPNNGVVASLCQDPDFEVCGATWVEAVVNFHAKVLESPEVCHG